MSLTPEQRRRIREEEEARVAAEEEARYRAQVRAELEGRRAPEAAPEPEPGPTSPSMARVRPSAEVRSRRASRAPLVWGALAGLSLVGAAVLVVLALRPRADEGAGADRATDVELTLATGGAVGPMKRPAWRPESLATEVYTIGPDGRVASAPGPGVATLDELRAAFAAPAPVMDDPFPKADRVTLRELAERYRASPPDMSAPRLRLRASPPIGVVKTPDDVPAPPPEPPGPTDASLDGLLRFVPPSAWLVIGLDRAGVVRSPALAELHATLARALGSTPPLTHVGGQVTLAAADRLVYAAALPGVDAEEEFLVVASADAEGLRGALAGRSPVEAVVPHYALGDDGGVVVEDGTFAAARPRTLATMLAARATDCIAWSGAASAMVRRVRDASALFAVIDREAAGLTDLDEVAPGLGAVRVLGARVDVGTSISLTLFLDFADGAAATTALAALEHRRVALAGAPASDLIARIRPTIDGPRLSLVLDLAEAELASLLRDAGLR